MNVFIIAAMSADGYIGRGAHHLSTEWTTKADIKFFVRKTKEAGTMVMGSRTFGTIGKALKDRRLIVYTQSLANFDVPGVEATDESPTALVQRLESEGVKALAVCGGASIYSQFMQAGLVDELYITIMPKVLGSGLTLFTSEMNVDLRLLDTEDLGGGAILHHYQVTK